MYRWCLLLFNLCVALGSFIPDFHSEGPRRPGAFVDPDGNQIIIDAGDVGLYPTGMFDDTIDYITDVKFFLFTRLNPDDGQQLYLNNQSSITLSNFNSSIPTKIVIHGFENNLNSSMIQLNKDAFLANDVFNVIAVDWSALATNFLYPIVVSEVPGVGTYVGLFINFLVTEASVNAADVHIIGHSLGAHVSGFAGKTVQKLGYNVSRITGLDPALPGYVLDSPALRLAYTDADFVDCIHTCAGFLGFATPICQADFYPNGGTDPQPGCPWLIDFGDCSHGKAYEYFAASINLNNSFDAEGCDEILFDIPLGCYSEGALMGYPATEIYQGKFYLETDPDYPYAKTLL